MQRESIDDERVVPHGLEDLRCVTKERGEGESLRLEPTHAVEDAVHRRGRLEDRRTAQKMTDGLVSQTDTENGQWHVSDDVGTESEVLQS